MASFISHVELVVGMPEVAMDAEVAGFASHAELAVCVLEAAMDAMVGCQGGCFAG